MIRAAILLLLTSLTATLRAEAVRIAVASNFDATLAELVDLFHQTHPHRVVRSPGSTGKHYAQIVNGAPFDLFFAADAERPRRLEAEGIAAPESRFTYAVGQLVLWSPRPDLDLPALLRERNFRHLAIANPDLAPYGEAARQVLHHLDLWDKVRPRLVMGANIAQTAQFVRTGAADPGFIALSQIRTPGMTSRGSVWTPPPGVHDPIAQQAVVLNPGPGVDAFLAFLRTRPARAILTAYGYGLPALPEEAHAPAGGS